MLLIFLFYNSLIFLLYLVPGEVVNDDGDEEEEDEDDDYEDDENAYEEEEGEFEILFERPAALVAEIEGVTNSAVKGNGAIRIILQPNHSYVVEMEDVSGQVLCRAPITGDVEVSVSFVFVFKCIQGFS